MSPDIVHHRLPKRSLLRIEPLNLLVVFIRLRSRSRREQKNLRRNPKRDKGNRKQWKIAIVELRDISHAVEMRHYVCGQPAAVTTQHHDAVDACCEETDSGLHVVIVDDRAIGCDAAGRFDAVDAGGDFEGVEWDVG